MYFLFHCPLCVIWQRSHRWSVDSGFFFHCSASATFSTFHDNHWVVQLRFCSPPSKHIVGQCFPFKFGHGHVIYFGQQNGSTSVRCCLLVKVFKTECANSYPLFPCHGSTTLQLKGWRPLSLSEDIRDQSFLRRTCIMSKNKPFFFF